MGRRREHNELLNLTSAMLERILMPPKFFRKQEKSNEKSFSNFVFAFTIYNFQEKKKRIII